MTPIEQTVAEERRETPPTPWTVRLHDTTIEILDADGAPVQWTKRSPKSEACVRLIVEAVNWYTAWGEDEGEGKGEAANG
jgi:hypothetical protein